MAPGPAKNFEPELALEQARDLFWSRGYDGTSIRDLEEHLGVGRKSLYDTFGSKRELYLRAVDQYADTVIRRIREGLEDPARGPLENIERVLGRLQRHHGSTESLGCLLGVAMGQSSRDDQELGERVRRALGTLEDAFARALVAARDAGELRAGVDPKDSARQLVALTQGMALMGRVALTPARSRSIVRAALEALRA